MKNTVLAILVVALNFITNGCSKDGLDNTKHHLKFSRAYVHITNKLGSANTIKLESDLKWKLSFDTPAPDWLNINKMSGINCDSILITATKANNTAKYKIAILTAVAVDEPTILPAQLTIVQYDSTYKGK